MNLLKFYILTGEESPGSDHRLAMNAAATTKTTTIMIETMNIA